MRDWYFPESTSHRVMPARPAAASVFSCKLYAAGMLPVSLPLLALRCGLQACRSKLVMASAARQGVLLCSHGQLT